jgi:outer membrane receptor for ferrienterochelin and colicin
MSEQEFAREEGRGRQRGRSLRLVLTAALVLLPAFTILAQAIPSATLSGRVSNEGTGLPGVGVTVTSPNLQGSRSAVTSVNGDYVFSTLPPGDYTVEFKISGFQPVTRRIRLGASQKATLDSTMNIASVSAETTVVAASESISTSSQAATTYTSELMNKLPVARTLLASVALAPGVNQNGPNGAVSVSGAQSYENLYTVNGVVITDNIRGTPNNLFIEDSIQETTTSTSAVSAEYGRFTGGVINAITKNGGNDFSGSLRSTLTNPVWVAQTPAGEPRNSDISPRYEATLGGPLWKDRIWFFGAGRYLKQDGSGQTVTPDEDIAPISYGTVIDEKRYEGKLTISPFQNQTLVGSYMKISREEANSTQNYRVYDLASLVTRQLPQELLAVNYNGSFGGSFFLEAQFSQRKYTFENAGSRYTDLILGTNIIDALTGARYNSPTFCGVCDPESRDNKNYLLKGTYFLSSEKLGSHNIVFGYDNFAGMVKSNNYQSGSNYTLGSSGAIFRDGDIFPVIDSGSYVIFWPIEQLSQGSDLKTHSAFVNDSWRLNDKLSFNAGLRWDKNQATDSSGIERASDSALSPRLAASYDVKGDGSLRVSASYARYVAALTESFVGDASSAGTPSIYYWYLDGLDINTNPNGPLQTREQVLRRVFEYSQQNGCWGANCGLPSGAVVPGVNVQIRESLKSPSSDEFTVGAGGTVAQRAAYRVDLVYRDYNDFYSRRFDMSNGRVTDSLGNVFDLGYTENSNELDRKYWGVHTQFQYRFNKGLSAGATYTLSRSYGNFDGETARSGPVPGQPLSYPEYREERWNYPSGDLGTDQRHRVRLYGSYDIPMPKTFGNLNVSLLQSFDTGTPYGAFGTVTIRPYVTNPGYLQPPVSSTYYFTGRDEFRTEDIWRTDLALNYAFSAGPVEIFVQPQLLNAFNNQGVIAVDQTVETATNRPRDYAAFDPFTSVPVRGERGSGANWNYAASFGKPRPANNLDYQLPRTFQLSVGVRF